MANRFSKYITDQASHAGPGAVQEMDPEYTPGNRTPFTEAVGYGMKQGLTGLENLGIRSMRMMANPTIPFTAPVEGAGPFSDSARKADQQMFESGGLANQPGAGIGRFTGEAITVPTLGRGASLAGKAGGRFARYLGERASVRAGEGALGAAQFSNPEDMGGSATAGSVLSMTLGRGGDAGKRLINGLVKKSEDAQLLEMMLRNAGEEAHIPISLSADRTDMPSKLVGGAYKNASPFFPLAGDVLEDQRKQALDKVRLASWRDAAPNNFQITAADLDNPDLLAEKVQNEFNRLYQDTVKSYAFNVPSDFLQQMQARIRKADPKINKQSMDAVLAQADELIKKFSDGKGDIEGQNLLYYKRAIGSLLKGAKPEEKEAIKATLGWVDEHIDTELRIGNVPQNLRDLTEYKNLTPAWRAFRAVVDSTRSARGGVFSPEQLARRAKPLTPEKELARTADKVLGGSATRFTPAGRAVAGALTMGAGIGLGTGLPGAVAATVGGLAAVSKPTQRALTGDTTLQQTLQKLAKELHNRGIDPNSVLGGTRRGIIAETSEDE